jgi:hypothetical protein
MSGKMKEKESKSSFLYRSEAPEVKSEEIAAPHSDKGSSRLEGTVSLRRIEESAARLRSRLCRQRKIL